MRSDGSSGSYGQYPQNLGFEVNIAGSEIGNPASYYGTNNFGSGDHHVPGLEQYHGSNIFLTESGVTKVLDVYEDYAEILFIPLMAYLVFSLSTAQRFEEMQRADELVRCVEQAMAPPPETGG